MLLQTKSKFSFHSTISFCLLQTIFGLDPSYLCQIGIFLSFFEFEFPVLSKLFQNNLYEFLGVWELTTISSLPQEIVLLNQTSQVKLHTASLIHQRMTSYLQANPFILATSPNRNK